MTFTIRTGLAVLFAGLAVLTIWLISRDSRKPDVVEQPNANVNYQPCDDHTAFFGRIGVSHKFCLDPNTLQTRYEGYEGSGSGDLAGSINCVRFENSPFLQCTDGGIRWGAATDEKSWAESDTLSHPRPDK